MLLLALTAYSDYIFLNMPESINNPGYYTKFIINTNKSLRVFMHYCNKSNENLYYTVPNANMCGAKFGYGVDYSPGKAGAISVNKFNLSPLGDLNYIKILILPGQTFSGIIEGNPKSKFWLSYFNYVNPKLKTRFLRVSKIDGFKIKKPILEHNLKIDKSNVYFTFGDENMNGFLGSYGMTHIFNVKNNTSFVRKYIVKISSRGGDLIFPCKIISQNTPCLFLKSLDWYYFDVCTRYTPNLFLKSRKWYCLDSFTLNPDELWSLENIITGGFNYPVEIAVVPVL
jgi:hypothetical protein